VGCFLAGCCYGRACPADAPHGWLDRLAVQYPLVADPGGAPSMMFNFAYWGQQHEGLIGPHAAAPLPILPVQLFEALGNLAICFVLLALWRRRKFSGQIFALYLMLYGALRFALEILRGDSERGLWLGGAISTSQIICIGLLAAGAVMWGVLRGRGIPPLPPPAEPAPAAATVKAGRPAKPRGRKPR
jgi:phosphatidylglycerol:prolipoprotein diacylglycerol transferase